LNPIPPLVDSPEP